MINKSILFYFTFCFISATGCKKEAVLVHHDKIIWAADWSTDGAYIAIGGNLGSLFIYRAQDFKIVNSILIPETITNLKWHPTENKLAILTQMSTGNIGILDVINNQFTGLDSISIAGARGLDWDDSGELLAVGDNDGDVIIFSEDGKFIEKVKCDPKSVTSLSWQPSKNKFVSVGSHIRLYDRNDKVKISIKPRVEEVLMLSVDWHPNSQFFVTGDYGDYDNDYPPLLQYWDESGKHIMNISGSKAEYRNIQWSSDGKMLVTASDRLRFWSISGELLKESPESDLLWGLDWKFDDTEHVTTSINGRMVIWNANGTIVER